MVKMTYEEMLEKGIVDEPLVKGAEVAFKTFQGKDELGNLIMTDSWGKTRVFPNEFDVVLNKEALWIDELTGPINLQLSCKGLTIESVMSKDGQNDLSLWVADEFKRLAGCDITMMDVVETEFGNKVEVELDPFVLEFKRQISTEELNNKLDEISAKFGRDGDVILTVPMTIEATCPSFDGTFSFDTLMSCINQNIESTLDQMDDVYFASLNQAIVDVFGDLLTSKTLNKLNSEIFIPYTMKWRMREGLEIIKSRISSGQYGGKKKPASKEEVEALLKAKGYPKRTFGLDI